MKHQVTDIKAHLAVLGSSLIFGITYWVVKGLIPVYLTTAQLLFYRVIITTALFWLTSLLFPREKVARKDLLRIAVCGMLGVALNQYFFFEGLRLSNPVEVSILHTTSPIMVLLFAAWIIKERITMTRLTGITLGAAGALIIVLYGMNLNYSSGHLLGNLFILLNICSYSLYLVLVKPVMNHYHPFTVMKWFFLFGMIIVAPFTWHSATQVPWSTFNGPAWIGFFYIVIVTTFLAFLLVIVSLRKLSAAVVGFYTYLQPLIAAIHGIILGQEKITAVKIIAAILIFSGVYFVNKRMKENRQESFVKLS